MISNPTFPSRLDTASRLVVCHSFAVCQLCSCFPVPQELKIQIHSALSTLGSLSLAMLINTKTASQHLANGKKLKGKVAAAIVEVLDAAKDKFLNIPATLQAAATTLTQEDDTLPDPKPAVA